MIILFYAIGMAAASPLGPSVKVKRVVPPAQLLEGIVRIQVDEFAGWRGDDVSAQLRQALQDGERMGGRAEGGGVVGDLIELGAEAAEAVVGEAIGGAGGQVVGGLVSDGVSAVGGAVGSDVIRIDDGLKPNVFQVVTSNADAKVSGDITVSEKVEDYKAKQIKDGNYVDVDCKRRIVTTDIHWRIVSSSGVQLAERTFPRKATDSRCGSEVNNLASKDELATRALSKVGSRIANEFAPYYALERIDFKRDKVLKEVLELHRQDQPMRALCEARTVHAANTYNAEAALALGAFHEGLGYVEQAVALYKQAASIAADKVTLQRQSEAEARLRDIETLNRAYGLTYNIGAPDYSMCPKLPDGRPAIVRRSTPLLSDKDVATATKRAELPKGIKVYIVEEAPGMLRVVTASGDEGWIVQKDVK